tara:strand:+ start:1284 stop:2081 length:798 start_codon:yes stop_codon:yes gene_type:complete
MLNFKIIENNGIVTDDNYYEDRKYITASMIKAACNCSKVKFDYMMDNNKETDSMLFGSAFHHLILEPDTFKEHYAFEPAIDKRTKAGKEYIAEWLERHKDVPNIISEKHEQKLYDMRDNLLSHPTFEKLMSGWSNSFKEKIYLFNYKEHNCKLKVDYYDPIENYIVDIKTCNSVNIDDIKESIDKYMYFIQAAFYKDALSANKFYFVFIEKKEPYDIVIVDYQSRLDDGRVCYSIGCSNIELFRTMDEQGDKEKLFYGENEIQLL